VIVSRRAVLLAAGAGVVAGRQTEASTLSIARELRRMVGFQIIAADDVRQSWSDRGQRYIQLRTSGLFRQVAGGGLIDPPGFAEAIVFAKPRSREHRLLIDGEFYHVVAFE
jgi:hypothetical protein